MAILFNQRVKHGALDFHPVAYEFENPDHAEYFKAAGWAADTDLEPVMTIGADEIHIDPETTFGSGERKGEKVLADTPAEEA